MDTGNIGKNTGADGSQQTDLDDVIHQNGPPTPAPRKPKTSGVVLPQQTGTDLETEPKEEVKVTTQMPTEDLTSHTTQFSTLGPSEIEVANSPASMVSSTADTILSPADLTHSLTTSGKDSGWTEDNPLASGIASNIVKVFSDKKSHPHDLLRALADMADEKSPAQERTAFFTSCIEAINSSYLALNKDQQKAFNSRINSKQVQALKTVLNEGQADTDPKSGWLRNMLRSNLAALDGELLGGKKHRKADSKSINEARTAIDKFIQMKSSQIFQFKGNLDGDSINPTKSQIAAIAGLEDAAGKTLQEANIAIRTNNGTLFLIDPNLRGEGKMTPDQLMEMATENLENALGSNDSSVAILALLRERSLAIVDELIPAKDRKVLDQSTKSRANTEFVIDSTCEDGIVRITASRESHLTAGSIPNINGTNSPLNPHLSSYKVQATFALEENQEHGTPVSVDYSFRSVPLDQNLKFDEPLMVDFPSTRRAYQANFARREKILESSGCLNGLNYQDRGNQVACDKLLNDYLAKSSTPEEGTEGMTHMETSVRTTDQWTDPSSNSDSEPKTHRNMEAVQSFSEIGITLTNIVPSNAHEGEVYTPDLAALRDARFTLDDYNERGFLDLKTARTMSNLAADLRARQLRLYTVLHDGEVRPLPPVRPPPFSPREDPKNLVPSSSSPDPSIEGSTSTTSLNLGADATEAAFSTPVPFEGSPNSPPASSPDGVANSLRLNAAIMAKADLYAEQLENRIVDYRERTPSANRVNDALVAAWQSREEFAQKQSLAMLRATVKIDATTPSDTKEANLIKALIQQANEFNTLATDALRSDSPDKTRFGTGLPKKKEHFKAANELTQYLKTGKKLPIQYKDMHVAQMMVVYAEQQADYFGLSKKETKKFVKELKKSYSTELKAEAAKGWEAIEHSFADSFVDAEGHRHDVGVTLSVIPKRHGEEQLAVASNSRAQNHTCNLATTKAVNSKTKQEYFSGVRHGILDAYDISKHGGDLQLLSKDERQDLLKNTKTDCDKILKTKWSINRSRYNRAIEKDANKFYFETRVGRNILRRAASLNMARELVQEAVLTSAVEKDQIKSRFGDRLFDDNDEGVNTNNQPLPIVLNSISLVTPDVLRQAGNYLKDKTHKTERNHLSNQVRAFKDLNRFYPNGVPVTVKDGDQEIEGLVSPTIRPMNFGVNKGALIKLPAGLMGWWRSDALNYASLEKLGCVYNTNAREWGDLQQVSSFVADEFLDEDSKQQIKINIDMRHKNFPSEIPALSDEKKARVRAVINGNPAYRANPSLYIDVISNLASDIGNVYTSKAHRKSDSDPYQMPAKLAQLSYLLGHNTAFNCKSGKDRSGQLDHEIKNLSIQTAVGHVPKHNKELSLVDQERKTSYVIYSGNMELQQYNTGLRGFKLFGVKPLFSQLDSNIARVIYSGDSKKVKA